MKIVPTLVVEMVVEAFVNTVEWLRYWGRQCSGGDSGEVCEKDSGEVCEKDTGEVCEKDSGEASVLCITCQ